MVNATSTTTLALEVTVTDGTNTWVVATIPASVATGYLDYTGEFKTDVAITSGERSLRHRAERVRVFRSTQKFRSSI